MLTERSDIYTKTLKFSKKKIVTPLKNKEQGEKSKVAANCDGKVLMAKNVIKTIQVMQATYLSAINLESQPFLDRYL